MEVSTVSPHMIISTLLVCCLLLIIVICCVDAVGADDSGADGTYEMMYEWSAKMPLDHKESIDTVCEGDIEENGQTSSGDITYCDIELVPKEFTEL